MKTITELHPEFLIYLKNMMGQVNNNLQWYKDKKEQIPNNFYQTTGEKVMLEKIIRVVKEYKVKD